MFIIAFLPRNKRLLISWLQSPSTVILEPKKIKSVTASTFSPSICHEVMELDVRILVFWMLSFEPAFSHSSFNLIKSLFSSSSLSAIRTVSSVYLWLLIFLLVISVPLCELWSAKMKIIVGPEVYVPYSCLWIVPYLLPKLGVSFYPLLPGILSLMRWLAFLA